MKTKTLLTVLLTTSLLPAALFADGPLPEGPKVVAGDITISNPAQTQLVLQQSSGAGIVDWGSFSIGAGYGVQVNNGNGATLNRVTGNDLSSIFGTLNATGSVYLVNQNGIVFGKSGVVNTGGTFVASTLDINNSDFLRGGDDLFAGSSGAYVINLGRISSLGGDVALLGRNVVNEGTITAPNGTVGLVAGREILMRDASLDDGLFSVRIGGADTLVTDSGAIRAAAAELRANGGNVYALAGNTDGTIAATGVTKVKGRVFLTAGASGNVKVDKTVIAKAADGKGGKITIDGGSVEIAGLLDVSGSSGGEVRLNSAAETVFSGRILAFGDRTVGTGGFVEVSGKHLTFTGTVDTGGGTVLIDPDNIEITDGSALLAGATVLTTATVSSLLATSDLIIQTTGSGAKAGTIAVSNALSVASPFVLTLLAHGDILANASIQVGDSTGGGLNLVAGWDGSTSTTAFDPAVFDAADLASQTIFGNATGMLYIYNGARHLASGSVFIGDGGQFDGVAVGTMLGDTRVYANDLVLTGSTNPDNFNGFAQLGYNVTNVTSGAALDSAISVRATGDITLTGGSAGNSAAQIGNIGLITVATAASLASSTAAISLELLGNLTLASGSGSGFDYAMVGNGSLDRFSALQASGDRSGAITIAAEGEISLDSGVSMSGTAWIGHATGSGTIANADIFLTAAAFDTDATTSVGSGGTGSLDIGMATVDLQGGSFTASATDSSLALSGSTGSSSCECSFIDAPNDLVVQASGDITLDLSFFFSNIGSGNVALAAGADFFNAGATAFGAMGGRWLIYSTRPDNNAGDINVLSAQFLAYNTLFDPVAPFSVAAGNGLIYSVQPVVEVANASMTYGGSLVLPGVQMTVNGIGVDPSEFGFSLSGAFVDPAGVTFSATGLVNAGVYASGLSANVTILPATVLAASGVATAPGQLTVDQAVLTGTIIGSLTKVYDGTIAATLTDGNFLLSGFISGEGGSVTQTAGVYASANASGVIGVSAALSAGDFAGDVVTSLSNYLLPTTVTGSGVITQAIVTGAIIGAPTKVYDATTFATLTAANYLLTGFVTGEGATVTLASGTYASANASGTNTVTTTLATGDFTATGVTLLSNYVLPTTVSGNGVILQAGIGGSIIGAPTKVYDGTSLTTLTAANYLLTGFVAGEGATVSQTVGSYGSANASGSDLITATLAAGDFAATGPTLLSNYVVPTTVSGNGVVTQALLFVSIAGLPTKPYDGTTDAALTVGNFLLSGFVLGEAATITQTFGTYAFPGVGTGNTITAQLAGGDYVAGSGTLLANYILPSSATGPGLIDKAAPPAALIPEIGGLDSFRSTPLGAPSGPATGLELISTETTQRIMDEINAGSAFCKALVNQEFVIDCLSDRLQAVADGLSAVGEYSEVRAALADAAGKLHALALANASQDLARTVAQVAGQRSSRALTAISTAALGAANAQAAAIIDGARLVLLRSSSGSERRSVAFTQVAQVVNSTKVLLRSS